MSWSTQKSVVVEKLFPRGETKKTQRFIAVACSAVVLTFSLTAPLPVHKTNNGKSTSAHPGKVLRTALPDETRNGDPHSATLGTPSAVPAILHLHAPERVFVPRTMPIPSVLDVRPAADRAPPRA